MATYGATRHPDVWMNLVVFPLVLLRVFAALPPDPLVESLVNCHIRRLPQVWLALVKNLPCRLTSMDNRTKSARSRPRSSMTGFCPASSSTGLRASSWPSQALRPSETKSLVTVSVAVVVFSLILAFGIRGSNVETLVSTATHAALLVVSAGTSSGGSGTSV